MIEVLHREFVYLWYYFDVQLRQVKNIGRNIRATGLYFLFGIIPDNRTCGKHGYIMAATGAVCF